MLKRQESLMGNRSFISKLPDKGKKISDFAEILRIAIAEQEELKRTTDLLTALRIDFQENLNNISKSKLSTITPEPHIKTMHVPTALTLSDNGSENKLSVTESQEEKDSISACNAKMKIAVSQKEDTKIFDMDNLKESSKFESSAYSITDGNSNTNDPQKESEEVNTDMLISAIQQVTIDNKLGDSETTIEQHEKVKLKKAVPFLTGPQKKLHCIEVLENRAENPLPARPKFKPNKLLSGSNESSHSPSPGCTPRRIESRVSAEAKLMRDQHLCDFTSAWVPPLNYMPVQILPIEESVMLQMVQKQTYEEMQAKLAAQKLAERLNIKMVNFNPDEGSSMKYREVRDEDYYSEDET